MKLSVIIPVYNTEKYIARCLESCLRQTLCDVEFIVINDGSSDASLKIILSYAERYKNIKVISTENRGLSAARNLGIDISIGKYIYFLDSDDWIEEKSMELCYQYAENNNLEIVTFDANVIIENGAHAKYKYKSYNRNEIVKPFVIESGYDFIDGHKRRRIQVTAWGVFLNRKFVIDNNIRFVEGAYYEDGSFHFECMLYAQRVMYIPYKFYNRTIRENSIITSSINEQKIQSVLLISNKILDVIKAYNGEHKEFWIMYAIFRIKRVHELVNNQIYFINIKAFQRTWLSSKNVRLQIMRDCIDLAFKYVKDLIIYDDLVELLYCLVRGFDYMPSQMLKMLKDIESVSDNIIIYYLKDLPLSDSSKTIGIYGSGRHADFLLDFYRSRIGKISCRLIYLDSVKKSYTEKKNGIDIVNIHDINNLDLDGIVIMSYKYEEEIYIRVKAFLGNKVPLYTIYNGKIMPFDMKTNKSISLIRHFEALPQKPYKTKRIVLLNTPYHTNSGDYMISMAEEKFLKKYFSDYEVLEFSVRDYLKKFEDIRNQIRISDIVCITGGGFLGNLWISGENVNAILKDFKSNKIIILPQSMYFTQDRKAEGLMEFHKYLVHCADVKVCFREKISYDMAQKYWGNDIETYLMPDIVLSIDPYEDYGLKPSKREGGLVCLREDKESTISQRERFCIWDMAKQWTNKLDVFSMHTDITIKNEDKDSDVYKKWERISKAEFVITDTLHCMISCAITGTPCIALNNLTGKIEGVFHWLKDCNYILYYDTPEKLLNNKPNVKNLVKKKYHYHNVFSNYEEILRKIITVSSEEKR